MSFTRVDGASGDASFGSVLEDCAEVTYHTVDSVRAAAKPFMESKGIRMPRVCCRVGGWVGWGGGAVFELD